MAIFIPSKLKHLRDIPDPTPDTELYLHHKTDNTYEWQAPEEIPSSIITAIPRNVWWVFGDSSDGGTTPDTATQASIDALLSAGVPSSNIRWLYEVDASTFTIQDISSTPTIEAITLTLASGAFVIADISSQSSIEEIVLTQSGGTFSIADVSSTTTIENITLINAEQLEFIIQDISSTPSIENVVLVLASGEFSIDGVTSQTTIENVVMSLAGGTFVMADISSTATIENVVLSEVSIGFTDTFTGTNNDAPNATYWDTTSLDADFTATI